MKEGRSARTLICRILDPDAITRWQCYPSMMTRPTGHRRLRTLTCCLQAKARRLARRHLVLVSLLLLAGSAVAENGDLDVVETDTSPPSLATIVESLSDGVDAGPVPLGDEPDSEAAAPCSSGPDVWVVNTRATFDACQPATATSRVRLMQAVNRCYRPATIDHFLATLDVNVPTVVWVHGNNSDEGNAREVGWQIYQVLRRCHLPKMRFVIWSWPSERITMLAVPDVRIKADVSEQQGYYLAWFLNQLPPETSVNVIGYSYGSRVTSSALHLLGGGTIQNTALADRRNSGRQSIRTLFMAAAQDSDGFARWGRYRMAPSQLSEIVVLINECDFVLRCYPRLEQPGGPPALGEVGLQGFAATPLSPTQIRQGNVSSEIGVHHSLRFYLDSTMITNRMRQFVNEAVLALPSAALPSNRSDGPLRR